jgi:[ribosomal protein S5]-alanine N-acetyltransferase
MRYYGAGAKTYEETREFMIKMVQHQEKHGFSSGNVYEKETGLFVGRAGLIYLEMNDNQPDIEVGYLLHKQFWNKGYATELTKTFLEWGFKHLSVNKLIASVRLENTGSLHVLEKAGMTYVGNVQCYGNEIGKYEISKMPT